MKQSVDLLHHDQTVQDCEGVAMVMSGTSWAIVHNLEHQETAAGRGSSESAYLLDPPRLSSQLIPIPGTRENARVICVYKQSP
jgi:hypothetical protein